MASPLAVAAALKGLSTRGSWRDTALCTRVCDFEFVYNEYLKPPALANLAVCHWFLKLWHRNRPHHTCIALH